LFHREGAGQDELDIEADICHADHGNEKALRKMRMRTEVTSLRMQQKTN
jgi:hypothetical protein